MKKTSINIQRCNIGSSQAHNLRTKEYMKHIADKKIYIRNDLTQFNESYVSPLLGNKSLDDFFLMQQDLYFAKFKQKMQLKDRVITNKKTGKTRTIAGASPIREGVLVIKDDTTMDEIKSFCDRLNSEFHIQVLEIDIHRDEGRYEDSENKASWIPNNHAHIIFNWMDLETAKSLKLDDKDMQRIQDLAAETLCMERGTSKNVTGKEHLDRQDFIVAKQKEEAAKAVEAKEKALQEEAVAKVELEKIKQEGKDNIKWLHDQEETELKKIFDLQKLTAEERKLNESLPESINQKKQELVNVVNAFNAHKKRLNSAKEEYQKLKENMQVSQTTFDTYKDKYGWQSFMLELLTSFLVNVSEPVKKAVHDVDSFAHANGIGHQDFFHADQASGIRNVMHGLCGDKKDEWSKVAEWLIYLAKRIRAMTLGEENKARKELSDIVLGRYDGIIAKMLGQTGGVTR